MLEHPTETLLEAPALVEWLARHGHGEWDAETLRQWIRHPVTPCPVARPGKPGRAHLYRPLDVVAWLSSREAQAQIHADPKMETDRQRARLLRLQADEREGLLVPAEQVERFPEPGTCSYLGVAVPLLGLAPFQASAAAKVRLALSLVGGK